MTKRTWGPANYNPRPRSKRHQEDDEQTLFFAWLDRTHPDLSDVCHHSPNGGKRDAREAAKFKRMGTRAGWPDITICLARQNYHGLFIEMKSGKNKVTKLQKEKLAKLTNQGYLCKVCYGAEEAKKVFSDYIDSRGT